MGITHAKVSGKSDGGDATLVLPSDWNAAHVGTPFGQTYNYPTSFSGDTINGSSTTPFVDIAAFDTKEVLNSRILHLQTLGASKDQRVRVTLGTTKAAAFDVAAAVMFSAGFWSAKFDTYLEVRGSTAADAQLFIARVGMGSQATAIGYDDVNNQYVRVGGSAIASADVNTEFVGPYTTRTLRFIRDGSNVISFYVGIGAAPMALSQVLDFAANTKFTATVSETLARLEFSVHTPSGPGSTALADAYVDWLASV